MARLDFLRRIGVYDYALAGFAGAAFTFAAFALPEWRLTQIALGSGLADIFPPAQPPLGLTARALFALAIGFVAFSGSLLLLQLAGRRPVAKRETTEADAPPEPIRLRRADAHPDAPPRRPLVARDLGEPMQEEAAAPVTAPAPVQEPDDGELLLAAEAELPSFLVEQAPEPVEAETAEVELEPEAPLVWAPRVEPLVEPVAEPAPVQQAAVTAEPQPDAEAEPSISKLMQRLEFGLSKREKSAPLDPASVASPSDDAVGHRLRSAIGDLQKLAARG
jgi:hypothetical protein